MKPYFFSYVYTNKNGKKSEGNGRVELPESLNYGKDIVGLEERLCASKGHESATIMFLMLLPATEPTAA
jgi:hypothetical protein